MIRIEEEIISGDIVNIRGMDFSGMKFFDRIARWVVCNIIKADQRFVFGRESEYRDHHTMIYIDPDHLFSVHPPRPEYIKISDWNKKNEILTIYRYQKRPLEKFELEILKNACDLIIGQGQDYDIGQLADILLSSIAGYPFSKGLKVFDQGNKNLVCSVGCASAYNFLRHHLWYERHIDIPQLFRKLNPLKWSKNFLDKFRRIGYWDIDRTFPANFANTDMFDNEFKKIGEYFHGEKIT